MPVIHDDAASTLDSVTGINGVQHGGTGANLSATGPGFLKQATLGAAVTVSNDLGAATATTAAVGTNTTQIATTAFVQTAVAVFDVRTKGAACDGTTDDYTAIAETIAAAVAAGDNSVVRIPDGKTCKVVIPTAKALGGDIFTLSNGVTISGKGTLTFSGAAVGDAAYINYFAVAQDESAYFKDITIQGEADPSNNLTYGRGVYSYGVSVATDADAVANKLHFERVTFTRMDSVFKANDGDGTEILFRDCIFEDIRLYGIQSVIDDATHLGSYMTFENCWYLNGGSLRVLPGSASGLERVGIWQMSPVRSFVVDNCKFIGGTDTGGTGGFTGISTTSAIPNVRTGIHKIVNSTFDGAGVGYLTGVTIASLDYSTSTVANDVDQQFFVSGNHFRRLAYGILVWGGRPIITGNTMECDINVQIQTETALSGVKGTPKYTQVKNNTLRKGYGVKVAATVTNVDISGNTFDQRDPTTGADSGVAAISFDDLATDPSDFMVAGNQFYCGGYPGIVINSGTRLWITQNIFEGTSTSGAGAIWVTTNATAGLVGAIWDNDFTRVSGGGSPFTINQSGLVIGRNFPVGVTGNYASGVVPIAASTHMLSAYTTSTAITNTTTETAFSNSAATVVANTVTVGSTIRVRASGAVAGTGADTVTLRVRLGGVTIASIILTPGASSRWSLDTEMVVREGPQTFPLRATATYGASTSAHHSTTGLATVVTSSNGTLDISAQWSAADPANTITLYGASYEISSAAKRQ